MLTTILSVFMKILFLFVFFLCGHIISDAIQQSKIDIEKVRIICQGCLLADFVVKFFMKSTDVSWLTKYVVLPIRKIELLPYYIADELLSIVNYYWVALVAPIVLSCEFTAVETVELLSFTVLGSWFNSLLLRWMAILMDFRIYFCLLPLLFVTLVVTLDLRLDTAICTIVFVALNVIGYQKLFDYEIKNAFQNHLSNATGHIFNTGSVMLNLLVAEVFHTSIKKTFIIMLFVVLNLGFSLVVLANNPFSGLLVTAGLFAPLMITSTLSDSTFAAESTSFDGLQICPSAFLRRLFLFKMRVASILILIVSPIWLYSIGLKLIQVVSFTVFTEGVLVPLSFSTVIVNNRRANLFTKGLIGAGSQKKQSVNFIPLVVFFVVYIMVYGATVLFSQEVNSAIWFTIGAAAILYRRNIVNIIWERFESRRYYISSSFRIHE